MPREPRQNRTVAALLAATLVAAPVVAQAHGTCLTDVAYVGQCTVSGKAAIGLGVAAGVAIIAGAAYTIVDELNRRTVETGSDLTPVAATTPGQLPTVALLPTTHDRYRQLADGSAPPQNAAVDFDSTKTQRVVTVVAGAAVLGAIIAAAASKHH
jgi:hypothetical protein